MVDAVGRTLFRLFIRRRRLLEWVTAAQANDDDQFDRARSRRRSRQASPLPWSSAIALYFSGQRTWPIAAPFVVAVGAVAARRAMGEPAAAARPAILSIAPADALALRLIARRTWRFFEKFVTAEDNMLPPDNFQEDPKPVVAHRTSPTNIGLYLLSVIAARDFGWLGTLDALERLEATFATMDEAGALPRPFLQLVRHERPARAGAEICLLGG